MAILTPAKFPNRKSYMLEGGCSPFPHLPHRAMLGLGHAVFPLQGPAMLPFPCGARLGPGHAPSPSQGWAMPPFPLWGQIGAGLPPLPPQHQSMTPPSLPWGWAMTSFPSPPTGSQSFPSRAYEAPFSPLQGQAGVRLLLTPSAWPDSSHHANPENWIGTTGWIWSSQTGHFPSGPLQKKVE